MQFSITLTPNRTTQKQFARLTSYRRNGRRMARVLVSYNRFGKVDRTKVIRINEESKDWTKEQAGPRQRAFAMREPEVANSLRNTRVVVEAWLEGTPVEVLQGVPERTVQVAPTAKRDWLIAMGLLFPNPHDVQPWHVVWSDNVPCVSRASAEYLQNKVAA